MKVRTSVRAGRLASNHSQTGVRVKSQLRAGRLSSNHNQARRTA